MGRTLGIADRTDYDLTQHQNVSKADLTYFDDTKNEKYIPYLLNHHLVQTVHLHSFARHMMKKRSEKEMSEPLCIFILRSHRLRLRCFRYQRSYQNRLQRFIQTFATKYNCEFDERGNIGRRYRRQDEIGTHTASYDFDSVEDGAVTVATVTVWSRSVLRLKILTNTSKTNSHFKDYKRHHLRLRR